MKTVIIILLLVSANGALFAGDDIPAVLAAIEANNATLKSLRQSADARKLENRTGIYLPNPELNFNFLRGRPDDIGRRTDFSFSQTFDIPAVAGMKRRIADGQDRLVERQYQAERMELLLQAKLYCIELIYCNALGNALDLRLLHAATIAAACKERMERGEDNILEYNRAMLNLSTLQGEMEQLNVERQALLEELKRLNGGIEIRLDADRFAPVALPDFDEWYAQAEQKNPALAYVRQEVEVSKKQVSLSKALGLPSFSAGYMSEKAAGQHFRGISVGVSIPLWETGNRVKRSKAALRAAESKDADSRQQFYSRLRILYNRTLGLKATADIYRKSLETANSSALLKQALDAGEISLLDYLLETSMYHDAVTRALAAERDYLKAHAELSAAEL